MYQCGRKEERETQCHKINPIGFVLVWVHQNMTHGCMYIAVFYASILSVHYIFQITVFLFHCRKKTLVSDQNGKVVKSERKRVPKTSLQKEGPADDRERKERHENRRLEKGKSQDYPDLPEKLEEGKVPDDEKQKKEDEYHTRYRSDPNLARYPVKPHPEEQQMRMHAKVSKARHERRHSDVALPHTEMEEAEVPENNLGKRSQLQGTQDRKSLVETQRSYSIDRTGDVRISVSKQLTNHSPPTPRHSPVPIEHVEYKNHDTFKKQSRLDPSSAILMRKAKREKMETMLRNDSLSSDQSESVRPSPPKPHRAKRGGKKRQMSVSSSEEEGASTPEYTSCEDVEIESESVSEKGKDLYLYYAHGHVFWGKKNEQTKNQQLYFTLFCLIFEHTPLFLPFLVGFFQLRSLLYLFTFGLQCFLLHF